VRAPALGEVVQVGGVRDGVVLLLLLLIALHAGRHLEGIGALAEGCAEGGGVVREHPAHVPLEGFVSDEHELHVDAAGNAAGHQLAGLVVVVEPLAVGEAVSEVRGEDRVILGLAALLVDELIE